MAISAIAFFKIFIIQLAALAFVRESSDAKIRKIYFKNIAPLLLTLMLVMVVSPELWILYTALAFTMFLFGRNPDHAPGVFLCILAIAPSFSSVWEVGSVKLILVATPLFLGISAFFLILTNRSGAKKFGSNFWIVLLIFATFSFIASARGLSVTNMGRELLQTCLTLIFPVIVMAGLITRVRDIRVFIAYTIATAVVLAAMLLFESLSGWSMYRSIYAHVGIPPVWDQVKWREGILRASGPIMEATSMGFIMVFFAIFAWCSRGVIATKGWRYIITAFMFVGVYVTQSRNPIIGLTVAFVAYIIYSKMKNRSGWAGYSLALFIALSTIVVVFNIESSTNAKSSVESTLQYRQRLFDRGIEEVAKKPIFGQSIQSIKIEMKDLVQGERIIDFVNSYLYVTLISGVIGLTFFVFALFKIPANIWANRKHVKFVEDYGFSSFIFSVSFAVVTMAFFTFMLNQIALMYLILLSISVWINTQIKLTLAAKSPLIVPT